MKTFVIPLKSNSCNASGQFTASSLLLYSTAPPSTSIMLATNFMLFGLGVNSAYMLSGMFMSLKQILNSLVYLSRMTFTSIVIDGSKSAKPYL